MAQAKKMRAMAYYRLSEKDKRDKSRAVSESIENQRKLICEYAAKHDIELAGEKYDDGYTGTNYDRPGFCAVMKAAADGDINCIIVKDLSRLGREYIETGRYIESTFPSLGIRFISVNDDYDSDRPRQSDDIIVPVKNLMNEAYCRELSIKLRKQFAVQRSNGEYLGAFACYGYRKSPEDKHKLVIDEYAAEIVRGIFISKTRGYSRQAIANELNREGVLSPSEYKRQQGLKYRSGFKNKCVSEWSAATVSSILKNRVYTGALIQGKRGTPNFKVKTVKERAPEEWTVVENNHEAIVDKHLFDVVQKMLGRDTRTPPNGDVVLPLAGTLFCADCGRAMCLRSVRRGDKRFSYYVCSTYKRGGGCSCHSLEKERLEASVLKVIASQISLVVELDSLIGKVSAGDVRAVRLKRVDAQINEKLKELEDIADYKDALLSALSEELIDRDEYRQMRDKYRSREARCRESVDALTDKRRQLELGADVSHSWAEQYIRHRSVETLTREVVVALIDRITVFEDKRIEIAFNYNDEIRNFTDIAEGSMKEVG